MLRNWLSNVIYFLRLPFYYVPSRRNTFPTDLKICISTHINYSEKSLPKLINSLKRAKVPSSQIYIFEGGHIVNNKEINKEGMVCFKVNYNSFDITSLIGILENNLTSNGWFLLHDTVTVLPCFTRLINRVDWRRFDTVQIKEMSSMNIGIYKGNYLRIYSNDILKFKNFDYSAVAIQRHKVIAIDFEDFLFKKSTNNFILKTNLINYFVHNNINYCGSRRRRETFMNIGIVKFKANYTAKHEYRVTV